MALKITDETVLVRVPGTRALPGVPDRDLHLGDIHRVATVRTIQAAQDAEDTFAFEDGVSVPVPKVRPAIDEDALDEAGAWLIETGSYEEAALAVNPKVADTGGTSFPGAAHTETINVSGNGETVQS